MSKQSRLNKEKAAKAKANQDQDNRSQPPQPGDSGQRSGNENPPRTEKDKHTRT